MEGGMVVKKVTAVVQAEMLAAWTRVVAVRLRKEFEMFVKSRIDGTERLD